MGKRVCFIHGGGDVREELGREAGVRTVSWADATSLRGQTFDIVVVDADLTDFERVSALRSALETIYTDHLIFFIDKRRRLEQVQAGVLGATEVRSRPLSTRFFSHLLAGDLDADLIGDRLGRGAVPARAPGAASILAADAALGDLFSACLSGGVANGERLRSASREVSGAIRDIGLDPWLDTVRSHHSGTYQHCLLVTGIAVGFGSVLQMAPADTERLAMAGLVHDVGKAWVPVELLDKPGRLTEAEFAVMKTHPEAGYDYLVGLGRSLGPETLDVALHHHEMLDGSGYPHGLSGRSLNDLTRIMTVCDIYGALAEKRAYKAPMTTEEIILVFSRMVEMGKLERALVRALEAVLTGDGTALRRPTGLNGWRGESLRAG